MSSARDSGGPQARDSALKLLADLIARGGPAVFLRPPVIPGEEAFPDAWAPSKVGVQLLLRRLVSYADIDVDIAIDDRRAGAPPTERKPATRAELLELRGRPACFALGFIGTDD